MTEKSFKTTQYICAVLLIISSIAMVSYQVLTLFDVAGGLLIYIGQAFLLAASIFGLDYYVHLLAKKIDLKNHTSDESPS